MTVARSVTSQIRKRSSQAVTLRRLCRGYAHVRLAGADDVGKRAQIIGKANLQLRGTTRIGDQFMIEGTVAVLIKVAPGAYLSVGDNVYMNSGTSIEVYHEVIIGSNVLMAPFVSIIDDDCHQAEPDSTPYKGPTIVGSNVWLGRNTVVLPGASIGDGAVIGANSVVTGSIPPNTFAAGSPAQVLRKLEIPDGWVRTLTGSGIDTAGNSFPPGRRPPPVHLPRTSR
jgi:acetyltransferase-like isoleucine patch superfamily enzyme